MYYVIINGKLSVEAPMIMKSLLSHVLFEFLNEISIFIHIDPSLYWAINLYEQPDHGHEFDLVKHFNMFNTFKQGSIWKPNYECGRISCCYRWLYFCLLPIALFVGFMFECFFVFLFVF